jgi:hypothetical protein
VDGELVGGAETIVPLLDEEDQTHGRDTAAVEASGG